MFDPEKFIECIRHRSCLWAKESKEYSDRVCRDRAWTEIGEIMYQNWHHMELQVRDQKVKVMKLKWRHIRDSYVKYVNQENYGSLKGRKKKKYIYADNLSFLLDTLVKRRKFRGKIDDDAEGEDDEENDEDADEESDGVVEPLSVIKTEYHEDEDTKFEDSCSTQDDDADKSFLMSLLPDYRKLNDDEKIDFRLHALNFFQDIRRKTNFPNVASSSASGRAPYLPSQMPPMNPLPYQFQGYLLPMQSPPPMQTSNSSHDSKTNKRPVSPQDS